MGAKKEYSYSPDYAVPPGDTLQETLDAIGMSQAEFAMRTGRPLKSINEIIKGKAAITPGTALQFERVLGVPASFWSNRERLFREAKARQEEGERLKKSVSWLAKWPIRPMARLEWIRSHTDKIKQVEELLNFLGVASPEEWGKIDIVSQATFRKSAAFTSDRYALTAWLRAGEVAGQRMKCDSFDEEKLRAALARARALTLGSPSVFRPELARVCAEAGVAIVFIPELPMARVSGATRWLSKEKALIQLSLRYKTNDHLWFTFFHEAGHILKHGRRDVFIEFDRSDNDKEKEADRFASNWLIPPQEYQRLVTMSPQNAEGIREFAARLGIAPGIVVGRLQHDRIIPFNAFNELKIRLEWSKKAA